MRSVSNGCSLRAAGRPQSSGATARDRSQVADGRDRLVDYLVANFGELVYV